MSDLRGHNGARSVVSVILGAAGIRECCLRTADGDLGQHGARPPGPQLFQSRQGHDIRHGQDRICRTGPASGICLALRHDDKHPGPSRLSVLPPEPDLRRDRITLNGRGGLRYARPGPA